MGCSQPTTGFGAERLQVFIRVRYHMAEIKPQNPCRPGPSGASGKVLTLELFESPFQLVVVVRHLPRVRRRQRPRDARSPLQFHYARRNALAGCTVEIPLRPPPIPIQHTVASARLGSRPQQKGLDLKRAAFRTEMGAG